MATSTFTFKDQNGNPVWGLATRIARNDGDTTKAEDERYPDKAGHTTFMEVKKVLPADNGHTLHWNYNEGLNPEWQLYANGSKHFSDIEDPAQIGPAIIIHKSGNQPQPSCPDKFDKPAVSNWFYKVANSVSASINSPTDRDKMKPGLKACDASWQHDSGGNTRARVFMDASGPNDDSPWAFDTGDEGKPFELTFRY